MEFYFHSTKLLTALQGILVFKIMSILQILTIFALQGGLGFIFFLNSTKPPILFALQGVLDFKYGIYVHFTNQLTIFYKGYMLRSRILFHSTNLTTFWLKKRFWASMLEFMFILQIYQQFWLYKGVWASKLNS